MVVATLLAALPVAVVLTVAGLLVAALLVALGAVVPSAPLAGLAVALVLAVAALVGTVLVGTVLVGALLAGRLRRGSVVLGSGCLGALGGGRGLGALGGRLAARPAPPWAPLIASMSWAFFMVAAPGMPMPAAIDLRSAISMELSPPPRFLGAPVDASGSAGVDSMVSVT